MYYTLNIQSKSRLIFYYIYMNEFEGSKMKYLQHSSCQHLLNEKFHLNYFYCFITFKAYLCPQIKMHACGVANILICGPGACSFLILFKFVYYFILYQIYTYGITKP